MGVLTTFEKWEKTKRAVAWLRAEMEMEEGMDRKKLEEWRGFLVYVSRTYPAMVPFLKGIHHTLDKWRGGRDDDGWKLTEAELQAALAEDTTPIESPGPGKQSARGCSPPPRVKPVKRLEKDLQGIEQLTEPELPPFQPIRSKHIYVAKYGFVDASGSGFGSSLGLCEGVRVRHGIWGRDVNSRSSNYRELRNLVESVEEEVKAKRLEGSELFLFTDNFVAENAFFKGTSSNEALFELIVRLKKAEMEGGLKLHVIHVSGQCMIAQGTDGLSRGDMLEGVMGGADMLSFVPLDKGAVDCCEKVLHWVQSWCGRKNLEPLSPEGWFEKGQGAVGGQVGPDGIWIPLHEEGTHLWSPSPAAADVAVEELIRACHKRPGATHVFVCPRLMTYRWRKQLFKVADVTFEVPAGSKV